MITAILGLYNAVNMRSNAENSLLRGSQAQMNLTFQASGTKYTNNPDFFCRQETKLQSQNIKNGLLYKISCLMEESYQKLLDKKIKDSAPKYN